MILYTFTTSILRWSDLLDTVSTILPSKVWNSLSPDLYATFWGLTLYDIYVPRSRYESEISKQYAALKALEELSDNLSSAIAKRKKDKERIQESLDRLTFELQKHEENVASVRRRLTHEKDKWWSDLDTVSTMLPSKAWNSLSPDLYATFWGLTLYDLYVPRSRYESEISKQHAAFKALEELSDNSSSAIAKRKKDKERIQESLDCITFELQKHEENVASVRRRLTHEKDKWLSSCPDTLKVIMEFLQRCIFPRCTFSMPDAVSLNLQKT